MRALVGRIISVLGDQLSHDLSALVAGDKARDLVVMAEVMGEARKVAHYPQKIILIFAAMRQFALELRDQGWRVAYTPSMTLKTPKTYAPSFCAAPEPLAQIS